VGEKEHARFTREGNNLVLKARLSLADALCGTKLSVTTLDGRTLTLPITEVVSPGYVKVSRRRRTGGV
jgi:DnaJ family protein B protein 4